MAQTIVRTNTNSIHFNRKKSFEDAFKSKQFRWDLNI